MVLYFLNGDIILLFLEYLESLYKIGEEKRELNCTLPFQWGLSPMATPVLCLRAVNLSVDFLLATFSLNSCSAAFL
jgi:hypothetical protein